MTDKIIETNSEQETRALGMELAGNARPGQIYALIGDLGVGKNGSDPGDCGRTRHYGAGEQSYLYDCTGL